MLRVCRGVFSFSHPMPSENLLPSTLIPVPVRVPGPVPVPVPVTCPVPRVTNAARDPKDFKLDLSWMLLHSAAATAFSGPLALRTDDPEHAALTSELASAYARLRKEHRSGMEVWMRSRDPKRSSLLQIGASSATSSVAHGFDPAGHCLRLKWKTTLVEPMPAAFRVLRRRFHAVSHISLINGAVCAPSCKLRSKALWYVGQMDLKHWGKDESDPRCLRAKEVRWVREIASLNFSHLLKHAAMLQSTPRACRGCSAMLNRTLPSTCLRHAIVDNAKKSQVECICLRELVPKLFSQSHSAPTLLLIDAEGRDADVLWQWPFDVVKPPRIAFESTHLLRPDLVAVVRLLLSQGYANLHGALRHSPMSLWQLVES